MGDLAALRERVAKATGADWELDRDIWRALCWQDHWREIVSGTPFTGSIDAAVALVERTLPGAYRIRIDEFPGNGERTASVLFENPDKLYVATAWTSPLAILSALLAALDTRRQG